MAAAQTIASFVGSDQFFDGTTFGTYDLDEVEGIDLLGQFVTDALVFEAYTDPAPVVLQWDTLTEAAEQAGDSRIYGGIHIQDGNLNGLEVDARVAANAETRWDALFTRGGDDQVRTDKDGGLETLGAGNDTLRGRQGQDIAEGGSGADDLRGHKGDDILLGEAGDDHLFGGKGDDILAGGAGTDSLKGGVGDDSFVFFAGETGMDYVKDFAPGADMLILVGFGQNASLDLIETRGNLILRVDGTDIALLKQTDAEDMIAGENLVFEDSFTF